NYLKIAYRNFSKNKFFSSINILGLSIGMAVCLVIIQYVVHEFSYDKFHKNGENIFRMRSDGYTKGELDEPSADCVAAGGKAIYDAFPEVLDFVKLTRTGAGGIFTNKESNIKFREENVYYATSSLFRIFSFDLISGDAERALSEPNNIIISRSIAEKYFHDEDPMGKILNFNGVLDYSVSGVFEDIPTNSHMRFDILTSFPTMLRYGDWVENSWAYTTFYTYLLLQDGTDTAGLERKINEHIQMRVTEVRNEYGFTLGMKLQQLYSIHLNSNYIREIEQNGDYRIVYFMLIIAMFVLIIAWINYINL
ncbi:MAG: ABC transporter permease, partial [bacterium]|nr:ABC transporter permease [bacterium]